jgi:hypothetical protein
MEFYRRRELAKPNFPLLEWYLRQSHVQPMKPTLGLSMAQALRPTERELKENSRA